MLPRRRPRPLHPRALWAYLPPKALPHRPGGRRVCRARNSRRAILRRAILRRAILRRPARALSRRYLRASGCYASGRDDGADFAATVTALGRIGVGKEDASLLWSALAGVLLLGEIEFEESAEADDAELAQIAEIEKLHAAEQAKADSMRRLAGQKGREASALSRQVDDVPTSAELMQYERRFRELYATVASKLEETCVHRAASRQP